jgi:hypothetical protein
MPFANETKATCVQKIKFVVVVVFEKKRFEAIVDGNVYTYERPWHKERRRNSSVLKKVSVYWTSSFQTSSTDISACDSGLPTAARIKFARARRQ